MATRMHRETHNIEQTQKVIPLIPRETSFGQNVSELVFGVNIFDLDLGFQIDSVEQPVKSNFVGSRHMSHRKTSSFDYYYDHSFVVFKNVQLRFIVRGMCVGGHTIHIAQLTNLLSSLGCGMKSISFLSARMVGLDIVVV